MPTKSCRLSLTNPSNRSVSILNKFVSKRKHKRSTKGTNLQSRLLKNKISCFCDAVKIHQPARLWNYSRDILAFLLCQESSLSCCFCAVEWDTFPSVLQFSLQAASSGVLALLRGKRTRALDPEQLHVRDSREWGPALDTFQSTKGLTSSHFDC